MNAIKQGKKNEWDTSKPEPVAELPNKMNPVQGALDEKMRLSVSLPPKRRFRVALPSSDSGDLEGPVTSPSPRLPRMKRSGHFKVRAAQPSEAPPAGLAWAK